MDKNARVCDEGVQIIYRNNKAYGIREKGGFLFFFTDIGKWEGQDERYRTEVEEQLRLADFLLKSLKSFDGK